MLSRASWEKATSVDAEREAGRRRSSVELLDPLAVHLDAVRRAEVDERVAGRPRAGSRRGGARRSGRRPGCRSPSSGRARPDALASSWRSPANVSTASSRGLGAPRPAARRPAAPRLDGSSALARRCDRWPAGSLGGGRRRRARAAHEPRRDPELADREVVVGLEPDARRRQQRRSARGGRARRGSPGAPRRAESS